MKFLLSFIFLILIGCGRLTDKDNSKKNSNVTDRDIYEIVNFVIKEQDSLLKKDGFKNNPYKYIVDKDSKPIFDKRDSISIHKLDTIFSKEDLTFIDSQMKNRKDFRFNEKFINSKKIISHEAIQSIQMEITKTHYKKHAREIYEERFDSDLVYTIGLPVFSKDKKTVLIKFGEDGSGFLAIYKKQNNRWKFCYYVSSWIA